MAVKSINVNKYRSRMASQSRKDHAPIVKEDGCAICVRMTGIGMERICGMCRFEARVRKMSLEQYRKLRGEIKGEQLHS